jgi:hypothetical protein
MPTEMTPKGRVDAALTWETPDFVPFTVYEGMLPTSEIERRLRDQGLCIVDRRTPVIKRVYSEVTEEHLRFTGADGVERVRTTIHTPAGDLTSVGIPVDITTWHEKRLFTSPDDYEPLEAMIQDRTYVADYEPFLKHKALMGEDASVRVGLGYEPLQDIIYTYMGVPEFAVQWADNHDRLLHLYNTIVEERRKVYQLVADSPAWTANYGGNVSPEVVGLKRFEELIVPHYNEAAEILHGGGKLIGCHFDANTKLLAKAIAKTKLDYIEAFTPYPDTDMSVKDAREAWPDKVLWINYPSSIHLQSKEVVADMTRQMLREAAPGRGFLIGITEDVPEYRWPETFETIMHVCRTEGRLPIAG